MEFCDIRKERVDKRVTGTKLKSKRKGYVKRRMHQIAKLSGKLKLTSKKEIPLFRIRESPFPAQFSIKKYIYIFFSTFIFA